MRFLSFSSLIMGLVIGTIFGFMIVYYGANNGFPFYSQSTFDADFINTNHFDSAVVTPDPNINLKTIQNKNLQALQPHQLLSLIEEVVTKKINIELSPKLDEILTSLDHINNRTTPANKAAPSELQIASFLRASQLLDEAILNGEYNQTIQLQFLQESSSLTGKQNFMLQKKLAIAVNNGSIIINDQTLFGG